MPRIVVIGAGVMGASVAYRAALAGASVAVLEAGRIGAAVADEIVHGRRRPELADFRPARFFNRGCNQPRAWAHWRRSR
jgi:choline dehydrogenase-like flavoprotein